MSAIFAAASNRVASHDAQCAEETDAMRVRACAMRQEAEQLNKPYQTLARRRLLQDADDLDIRADRTELSRHAKQARLGEYAAAFSRINSTNGQTDMARAAPPPGADAETLPPGSAPPLPSQDCSLSFKQWLQERDLSSAQDNLVGEMMQELLGEVDKPKLQNSSKCPDCNRDLVLATVKAMLVCPECGAAQPHLDATPSCVAYDEGGRREMYNVSYTYKRLNHLFERLQQVQAREATVVTDELLAEVSQELLVQRTAPEDVTAIEVRDILKKLKRKEAYAYVVLITCRLQGRAPPKFTRETVEKVRRMFEAVQRPFERHCPANRNNFLSYMFALFKFLELLGAYDWLPYLALLKGKGKLQLQDAIWKLICADLDWEFIPTNV